MKILIRNILLIISLLLMTSCFDVLEKISLKGDGSGEYTIILNASKSKTRLESLSKMESFNGRKIPQKPEIEKKIGEASKIFKTTPGISNVKVTTDFSNYIVKLSCNFKKIENINAGLEQLKAKKIIGKEIPTQLYNNNVATKTFIRNKFNTFKNNYEKLGKADKEVFNNAKYVSVLQFDNGIKSQTNNAYTVSANKKALKLEGNITEFILQKKPVQNTIQLND